jgi:acyl-CoA thioesterase
MRPKLFTAIQDGQVVFTLSASLTSPGVGPDLQQHPVADDPLQP